MPSIIHAVLLALHATAFTALSQTAIYAVASPLPLPQPPTPYTPPILSTADTRRSSPRSMRIFRNSTSLSAPPKPSPTIAQVDHYSQFNAYYQAARKNSNNLKKLAAQSASVKVNDHAFQKNCVTQLNSFHTNVLGQQAALSALDAEKRRPRKGLENYDRTNDIETLFKNTVDLNKNTLTAIYVLVNNLPILGPVFGPIVYDIKCFLDAILNFCETFLDETINGLQPLLKGLLGSTPTAACQSGVTLLGLCI